MKIEQTQMIYEDEIEDILRRTSETQDINFYMYVRSIIKCGGNPKYFHKDSLLRDLINIHRQPTKIDDSKMKETFGSWDFKSWNDSLFNFFIVQKLDQGVDPKELEKEYGVITSDYVGLTTKRQYIPLDKAI